MPPARHCYATLPDASTGEGIIKRQQCSSRAPVHTGAGRQQATPAQQLLCDVYCMPSCKNRGVGCQGDAAMTWPDKIVPACASTQGPPAQCSSCCMTSLASLSTSAVFQQAAPAKLLLGDWLPNPAYWVKASRGGTCASMTLSMTSSFISMASLHRARMPASGTSTGTVGYGMAGKHAGRQSWQMQRASQLCCVPGGELQVGRGICGMADSLRAGTCS